MKKAVLLILILSVYLIGCLNGSVGGCASKKDLSKDEISTLDNAAKKYIGYLNDGNADELKNHLSSVAKTLPEFQNPEATMSDLKKQFGDIKEPKLLEVFKITTIPSNSPAMCGSDLSDKKTTYLIKTTRDLSEFVITIHEVSAGNGSVYFITEMVKESEEWKLRTFFIQLNRLRGNSADYYIGLADVQLEKGNKRNAAILYSIGSQLLINNDLVRVLYTDTIKSKFNSTGAENILTDKPSEVWITKTGKPYTIYRIRPFAASDSLLLQVYYITADITNENQIANESEEIANYVTEMFPEYKEVFNGLLITATEKIPTAQETGKAYNKVYMFDNLK